MKLFKQLCVLSLAFILFSCNNDGKKAGDTSGFEKDEKFYKEFQEKLILVEDGGTVEFPSGKYLLSKPLSMEGKKNITIKGAGSEKTVLSFLNQTDGAGWC